MQAKPLKTLGVLLTCAMGITASPSSAQWFTERDLALGHTIAYSQGREISITCSDQYGGPNIQIYTGQRLPQRQNPRVVFIFDGEIRIPWTATHTAEIYSGPLEDPYNNNHGTYLLWFDFDNFGEALGYWLQVVDWLSEHNSVAFDINGTVIGPYSLRGSAASLARLRRNAAYRC